MTSGCPYDSLTDGTSPAPPRWEGTSRSIAVAHYQWVSYLFMTSGCLTSRSVAAAHDKWVSLRFSHRRHLSCAAALGGHLAQHRDSPLPVGVLPIHDKWVSYLTECRGS